MHRDGRVREGDDAGRVSPFALIRTLYRAHNKRRLLSRYATQPQRLHTLLLRAKGREMCINKGQWGMGIHRLLRS